MLLCFVCVGAATIAEVVNVNVLSDRSMHMTEVVFLWFA